MSARKKIHLVLVVLLLSLVTNTSFAQIDLYAKINDPRLITQFETTDTVQMRCSNFQGKTSNWDPVNKAYNILAQDSGAGVISHIWITVSEPIKSSRLRIYIDDSIIVDTPLDSAFINNARFTHPPLANNYPISVACDVQIPYHHGFRVEVNPGTWTTFHAISWKHYNNSNQVPTLSECSQVPQLTSRRNAEDRFERALNPWGDSISSFASNNFTISPNEKQTLCFLSGPAMIRSLQVALNQYTSSELDSLWIKISWDNSSIPAVHCPIGLFFCTAEKSIRVNSVMMQWNSVDGFTSYFPMPFSLSANIELENRSASPINVSSKVTYNTEPIDRKKTGYFYADFSEINPTHYNVHHHVLHTKGIGRYVGMFLNIKDNSTGGSMEGDPIFVIDSNPKFSFRYTGTEDYFDGGWYFGQVLFSKGFSGHTKDWQSFYRLHILDAVDFHRSFDFDFQHGSNDDVREHYQTVAYYYKLTNHFWTISADTLYPEQYIHIQGSDYAPNTTIALSLDNRKVLETASDKLGNIDLSFKTSLTLGEGQHFLAINNETKPEAIFITQTPTIQAIRDTFPMTLYYGDSLILRGTGFIPEEAISLFIDDIVVKATTPVIADSGSSFIATIIIPNISDRQYHLRAQGNFHSRAVAKDLLTVTRKLSFEFEDNISQANWNGGSCAIFNCSYLFWYARWSRQEIALFAGHQKDDEISFRFYVPVNDTFSVSMNLTKGLSYGIFSYAIDGVNIGTFNGYYKGNDGLDPWPEKNIDLGKIAFSKDTHTIVFRCLGKDSKSNGYLLGADVLELIPTTTKPISPGTWASEQDPTEPANIVSEKDFIIYPNPVISNDFKILLPDISKRIHWTSITLKLVNLLGNTVYLSEPITKIISPIGLTTPAISPGNYFLVCKIETNGMIQNLTFPIIVL